MESLPFAAVVSWSECVFSDPAAASPCLLCLGSPLEVQMKSFLLCAIAIASVLKFSPHPPQRSAFTGRARRILVMVSGSRRGAISISSWRLCARQRARVRHRSWRRSRGDGALIGGAIAPQNQGYYYPDQNYPGYSDPGYVYSDRAPAAYNNGDSVAYCGQTYGSYDPASGSYLGYDGFRHACP